MRWRAALLAIAVLTGSATAQAGTDANTASEAELDGLRGVGPGLSGRILKERAQTPFRDWQDFIARVSGVGPRSAARLSAEGLTVQGQPYSPQPATSASSATK